ncbi:hypothetical protein D3C86_1163040 [compost metagenome]
MRPSPRRAFRRTPSIARCVSSPRACARSAALRSPSLRMPASSSSSLSSSSPWPSGRGALGAHVFTDAHRVLPVVGSRAGDVPIAQAVGGLDAAFVVGVVLSLLAALVGADLVAGEKERGTLDWARTSVHRFMGCSRIWLYALVERYQIQGLD